MRICDYIFGDACIIEKTFYDFRYGRYKINSDFFSILFSKKKILMDQKINYLGNKYPYVIW